MARPTPGVLAFAGSTRKESSPWGGSPNSLLTCARMIDVQRIPRASPMIDLDDVKHAADAWPPGPTARPSLLADARRTLRGEVFLKCENFQRVGASSSGGR